MTAYEEILSNLPEVATITLLVVFALIVVQEAVNGFHDAANAVATVIYSNSLKPTHAIMLSALMNFLGVLLGGTAVAFAIVFMLPTGMIAGINTSEEAALMLALISTAVFWNLATWWYGIPNSTTHTYIGSVMGVSMAHAVLQGGPLLQHLNLHDGRQILLTLLVSPIFGFGLAFVLYKLLRLIWRDREIYQPHVEGVAPPRVMRWSLIAGAAGVSFLHGSNDGQKSIGLMLMVLMGLAPGAYAIDPVRNQSSYEQTVGVINELRGVLSAHVADPRVPQAVRYLSELERLRLLVDRDYSNLPMSDAQRIEFRAELLEVHRALGRVLAIDTTAEVLSDAEYAVLDRSYDAMTRMIERVPIWLIFISALALGCGTMIGYRRIVETLGEKIGEHHMTPAQGFAAQLAAIASIGAADSWGMPVSTTHVLTSGVAGAVESSGDRVQWDMIGRILITWVTTLPGTVAMSFVVAMILHVMLGGV